MKELTLPTCENSLTLGHAVMPYQCWCNKADNTVVIYYNDERRPDTFYFCDECAKCAVDLALPKGWGVTIAPIYNF